MRFGVLGCFVWILVYLMRLGREEEGEEPDCELRTLFALLTSSTRVGVFFVLDSSLMCFAWSVLLWAEGSYGLTISD